MNEVFDEIIERLENASFWTDSSFDEDGYSNDDSEEVLYLHEAIEIVKQEAEKYNNGWIPVSEKLPEIDEAIAKYKEITNTDSNCPAHCNISCDKCVQESRQLVEWLEELKRRRDNWERCIGKLKFTGR